MPRAQVVLIQTAPGATSPHRLNKIGRRLSMIWMDMKISAKRKLCLFSTFALIGGFVVGGCVEKVYVPQPAPAAAVPPPSGPQVAPPSIEPPEGTLAPEVPPPEPQPEVVVGAPGPDYVWMGGYWNWNGVAWGWLPGRWALPPRHGAIWVGGRWDHRYGRTVWVRGRWR
jgi:hypothetical protein